jgi:hypothetical protein
MTLALGSLPDGCKHGDLLCVALDARAMRRILAAQGGAGTGAKGETVVVAADSPAFTWALGLADVVGLVPPDLGDRHPPPPGVTAAVWAPTSDRIMALVDAHLGEGRFGLVRVFIGRENRRRRDLVARLQSLAARHGIGVQVIGKEHN